MIYCRSTSPAVASTWDCTVVKGCCRKQPCFIEDYTDTHTNEVDEVQLWWRQGKDR